MGWDRIRQLEGEAATVLEHLIWDEYLLRACDMGIIGPNIRIWSADKPAVVLGYSNLPEREVVIEACRKEGIPILRRTSGGGAVLLDAGCLNYSLVLPITYHSALASVGQTNQYVMENHRLILQEMLGREVKLQGDTDLVFGDRKVSGNAQRRLRGAVLFHGSFLFNTDLELMGRVLAFPSRQPEYRNGRNHHQFVNNLNLTAPVLRTALLTFWAKSLSAETVSSRELELWKACKKRIKFVDPHS